MTPPKTEEIKALEKMKATVDPSIAYNFAERKRGFEESFKNPLGAYTTPAVRDAATRAHSERMAQGESQAIQESQQRADDTNYGRASTVAGMTAPQLVQTGGTSTQSQGWGSILGSVIGAAGQVGAASF